MSPAVAVCGWCKLTSDLDPHTCYASKSKFTFSGYLTSWPQMIFYLDLWPFDYMNIWRFPYFINKPSHGSNRTSTFQMRLFSHFQPILQLDLRWPLTLVYEQTAWTYEGSHITSINPSLVPIQGNFKGESVVAAILPSRMEASYCTFFKRELLFLRRLKLYKLWRNESCGNDSVRRSRWMIAPNPKVQ